MYILTLNPEKVKSEDGNPPNRKLQKVNHISGDTALDPENSEG